MFDKLFEFLTGIWSGLRPYYIVTETEKACILRWGLFYRVSEPGFYWKIPFADYVYCYHTITQTSHLYSQTLTTLDNKTIVIRAIVRYNISDIKKYKLGVWDAHDAINDTVQGIIGNIVNIVKKNRWEDVLNGIEESVSNEARTTLTDWGINIEKVTFSDLGVIKTLRLIKE